MWPKELIDAKPVVDMQPSLYSHMSWDLGNIDSIFFKELRDNKKIMGIKCPQCNCVYVPPRISCKKCFSELKDWVEVSDKGTLMTYTVVREKCAHQHMELPFAIGVIRLDGADTALVHYLGEVDVNKLKEGMRFQAVFKDQRNNSILDINYFKPL